MDFQKGTVENDVRDWRRTGHGQGGGKTTNRRDFMGWGWFLTPNSERQRGGQKKKSNGEKNHEGGRENAC